MKFITTTTLFLYCALNLTAATLSNYASTDDYWIYEVNPIDATDLLQSKDLADLDPALVGSSISPGGNVELFADSEGIVFSDTADGGAFALAGKVTLTVGSVVITSLNGADWFEDNTSTYTTAYGANNLANQWFTEFYAAMGPTVLGPDPSAAYNLFLTSGGFQQISDPNISYVSEAGGIASVGLSGFFDIQDVLIALTGNPLVPPGLQSSEVALVNGVAVYSFSATNSGVSYIDGSYSGNYEVTAPTVIPEPSAFILSAFGVLGAFIRRRN